MSLDILLAHTGAHLETRQGRFTSLDQLKAWVAQETGVPASRQILMTPRGKQVKYQTLVMEREIFLYDRDLLLPSSSKGRTSKVEREAIPSPSQTPVAPRMTGDEASHQAWQRLFKDRRKWAVQVSQAGDQSLERILALNSAITIIRRATAIAAENVKQHLSGLRHKQDETRRWADEILQHPSLSAAEHPTQLMERCQKVQLLPSLRRFFRSGDADSDASRSEKQPFTMQHLIQSLGPSDSLARAKGVTDGLQSQMKEMDEQYQEIMSRGSNLIDRFDKDPLHAAANTQQATNGLAEEMEVIVHKINADCETVLALESSSKALTTASKAAIVHTRDLLPSLIELVADIEQLLRQTTEDKQAMQDTALKYMQEISTVESSIAKFQPRLENVSLSEEDDSVLAIIETMDQLPAVYASVLVEAVRRREWSERMGAESASIGDDLAAQREDEQRRRRKWYKHVADCLEPEAIDSSLLTVNVETRKPESDWPNVTRADLEKYAQSLQAAGGFSRALEALEEARRSLDAPVQPRSHRTSAMFKNGSVHGASVGRPSVLRADSDAVQTLQNDKARLEDRLKGYESRVRKLEDLLHRTTQMQRPSPNRPDSAAGMDRLNSSPTPYQGSSINHPYQGSSFIPNPQQTSAFIPNPHQAGSAGHSPYQGPSVAPKPSDNDLRRPSLSSRPVSATFGSYDKTMLQRLVQLEADLEKEKARVGELRQQAHNHQQSQQDLMREVEDHRHARDKASREIEEHRQAREELTREARKNQDVHDDLTRQVQEATAMKRDLLDNFEAQKQEFDSERHHFQDENRRLKVKLEELEEEFDRAIGSHDQSRMQSDEQTRGLVTALAEARQALQTAQTEAQEAEKTRQGVAELERQKSQLEGQISNLETKCEDHKMKQAQLHEPLRSAYRILASSPATLSKSSPDVDIDTQVESRSKETLAKASASAVEDLPFLEGDMSLEDLPSLAETLQRHAQQQTAFAQYLQSQLDEARESQQSLQAKAEAQQEQFDEERKAQQKGFDEESRARQALLESTQHETTAKLKRITDLEAQLAQTDAALAHAKQELARLASQLQTRSASSGDLERRVAAGTERAQTVSLQLFAHIDRLTRLLESIGFRIRREDGQMIIQRVSRSSGNSSATASTTLDSSLSKSLFPAGSSTHSSRDAPDVAASSMTIVKDLTKAAASGALGGESAVEPPAYVYWARRQDADGQTLDYDTFIAESRAFDLEAFAETVVRRVKDTEHVARKWQREARSYREKFHRAQLEAQSKIAFRSFHEGDLALFLPTRNSAPRRSWAAFNVGAPHYFLREQDAHRLGSRDYLLARVSKIDPRVVDLSASPSKESDATESRSRTSSERGRRPTTPGSASVDSDPNPFGLSDGLRWYLLDASEDQLSAPITLGVATATVASAHVDAAGSIPRRSPALDPSQGDGGATQSLVQRLDRRRSSGAASRTSAAGAVPIRGRLNSPAGNAKAGPPSSLAVLATPPEASTGPGSAAAASASASTGASGSAAAATSSPGKKSISDTKAAGSSRKKATKLALDSPLSSSRVAQRVDDEVPVSPGTPYSQRTDQLLDLE